MPSSCLLHQRNRALAVLGALAVAAGCGHVAPSAALSAPAANPAVPAIVSTARHSVVVTSPNGKWQAAEFPARNDELLWWPVGHPGEAVREWMQGDFPSQPGGHYIPIFVAVSKTVAPASGYLVCSASMADSVGCYTVGPKSLVLSGKSAILTVVLTSAPPSQPVLTSTGMLTFHYVRGTGATVHQVVVTENPATGVAKRVVAAAQATHPGSPSAPASTLSTRAAAQTVTGAQARHSSPPDALPTGATVAAPRISTSAPATQLVQPAAPPSSLPATPACKASWSIALTSSPFIICVPKGAQVTLRFTSAGVARVVQGVPALFSAVRVPGNGQVVTVRFQTPTLGGAYNVVVVGGSGVNQLYVV